MLYQKVGSEEEEDQGRQSGDTATDGDHKRDGGSSAPSALYALALFLFIVGARRRREKRRPEEPPVNANGEVGLEAIGN